MDIKNFETFLHQQSPSVQRLDNKALGIRNKINFYTIDEKRLVIEVLQRSRFITKHMQALQALVEKIETVREAPFVQVQVFVKEADICSKSKAVMAQIGWQLLNDAV